MSTIEIRYKVKPGDLGRLVELHGLLYSQEYGFDHTFEAYVAEPLARFVISRTERERIWLVDDGGILMGSLAIVKQSDTDAQLRWFLLHPSLRGKALGSRLMNDAITFCHDKDYRRVFLWTVSDLHAAAAIYRKVGFQLVEEHTHMIWGCMLTEQRYDLELC